MSSFPGITQGSARTASDLRTKPADKMRGFWPCSRGSLRTDARSSEGRDPRVEIQKKCENKGSRHFDGDIRWSEKFHLRGQCLFRHKDGVLCVMEHVPTSGLKVVKLGGSLSGQEQIKRLCINTKRLPPSVSNIGHVGISDYLG